MRKPIEVAIDEVLLERATQNIKWGEQNHDPYVWLAILTEEVGELAQAMLHTDFGGRHSGKIREEAIHAAAVAIQFIEYLYRERK